MGKAMFSSDVVGTDLFLEHLSDVAQLCYYRLGHEGSYGKVTGVRRIARGYGVSMEALQELYDMGYLLDCGGCTWIRHYWLNNTFKLPNHQYALTMPEIAAGVIESRGKDGPTVREYGSPDGELAFEGAPFKSAFCLVGSNKAYSSLDEYCTYQEQEQEHDQEQEHAQEHDHPQQHNHDHRKGHVGEPTDYPPCPACGGWHPVEGDEGGKFMRCDVAGRTLWLEDGRWQ